MIRVIRERCSQAVHILDRFPIAAKMNDALDEVRAEEAQALVRHGREPVLKKTRWCLLKRSGNLTTPPGRAPQGVTALQLEKRPRVSAQGRLPAVPGVRLADLGRQVPRCLVHDGVAFPHRNYSPGSAYSCPDRAIWMATRGL